VLPYPALPKEPVEPLLEAVERHDGAPFFHGLFVEGPYALRSARPHGREDDGVVLVGLPNPELLRLLLRDLAALGAVLARLHPKFPIVVHDLVLTPLLHQNERPARGGLQLPLDEHRRAPWCAPDLLRDPAGVERCDGEAGTPVRLILPGEVGVLVDVCDDER